MLLIMTSSLTVRSPLHWELGHAIATALLCWVDFEWQAFSLCYIDYILGCVRNICQEIQMLIWPCLIVLLMPCIIVADVLTLSWSLLNFYSPIVYHYCFMLWSRVLPPKRLLACWTIVLMLQLGRLLECHRQIIVRLLRIVWVCIILKILWEKGTAKFICNLVTKQFPNDLVQIGLSELFDFIDFND